MMNSQEALKRLIEASGKSKYALSKELGKVPSYLGAVVSQGMDIKSATLARIAYACGFSLALINDSTGERIDITE